MENKTDNNILGGLQSIKSIEWIEVLSLWRDAEARLPRWIEHYKTRGFDSWDEWRAHTLKDSPYETLAWKLFAVEDPVKIVPHFLGGPFRAWMKKYYNGAHEAPFTEIIHDRDLAQSRIVQEILENFPTETYLIGVLNKKRVIIIDGMHRCCALALADLEKKNLKTKVFLALAQYDGDLPEMGQVNSPT